MNIKPIILCGGCGTRLWPLSNKDLPKQFLKINSDLSFLQETILRHNNYISPIIVSNISFKNLILEQLSEINVNANIILEPMPKNTLAAIINGLLQCQLDDLVLIMPSDHLIYDIDIFNKLLCTLIEQVDEKIITFGVTPTSPETGYGYINVDSNGKILTFIEKPNIEVATKLVESPQYFWNSGIIFTKVSTLLTEIEKFYPNIIDFNRKIQEKSILLNNIMYLSDEYNENIDISIDYAIMEKTNKAYCYELKSTWYDIGSFKSLYDIHNKNVDGNVIHAPDNITINSNNCMIISDTLVATSDISDLVIVNTNNTLMICDINKSQNVKNFQQFMKPKDNIRPWGKFDIIDEGKNFKVKKITVYPNQSLSLQKHLHRAEHWVIVTGKANVTCDDNTFILYENQSTFIPKGSIHRLSNNTENNLEIIEIQSGEYLGEDDIIRYDDMYGRVNT